MDGQQIATSARQRQMLEEVRSGLLQPSGKSIPSKYFYDERGSELFERITRLEEYYPTRTEIKILREHLDAIAGLVGRSAAILELGSGSSKKTRLLLDRLHRLAGYVPVDISEEYLMNVGASLKNEYPGLTIKPVVADYTRPFDLPDIETPVARWVAFYPGSTVGNFEPEEARRFLGSIAGIIGPSGGLLIGVDLKKDPAVLERAYNDAGGITAAFNKNILRRMNREIDTDFNPDRFEHDAFYNKQEGRIEMHLVSTAGQEVHLDGETIRIEEGETIHTENSYKYSLGEFEELVDGIFSVEEFWTDEKGWFSVQFLNVIRDA